MNGLIKVAALAAVFSVTGAFAGEYDAAKTTSTESASYSKLDTNRDGNISKDEAKADPAISAKFDELDADKSGSLSATELKAGAEKSKDK
jgi:hypothetical protein